MSFYRTDDPIADFEKYDTEQQNKLKKLPECNYCGHPIQDDIYYEIESEILCCDCLNNNFKKAVEDYVG